MRARTIMIQGTASSVGKSLLTAALCRIFRQDGWRVAPFKAQNMNPYTYKTADGLEISHPQGIQAEAAGVAPTPDMNPVILKPMTDCTSEVVIHGRSRGIMHYRTYSQQGYEEAAAAIRTSLARLKEAFDIVVLEGAGSPAEVNLRERELVNMRIAAWAEAPVLLVADIDRGGALAALVGTLELLEPEERDRVKGLIINKFRGDRSLLKPALDFLEQRTGRPVVGVVPYLPLPLGEEDGPLLGDSGARAEREALYDRLAVAVREALDMERIYRIMGLGPR
ncbi:MAG TPA: cobyric acid synthase [Symbiobacteriaceae bacterium]